MQKEIEKSECYKLVCEHCGRIKHFGVAYNGYRKVFGKILCGDCNKSLQPIIEALEGFEFFKDAFIETGPVFKQKPSEHHIADKPAKTDVIEFLVFDVINIQCIKASVMGNDMRIFFDTTTPIDDRDTLLDMFADAVAKGNKVVCKICVLPGSEADNGK